MGAQRAVALLDFIVTLLRRYTARIDTVVSCHDFVFFRDQFVALRRLRRLFRQRRLSDVRIASSWRRSCTSCSLSTAIVLADVEPVVPTGPDEDPESSRSSICCISTICVRTSSSVVGVVVARGDGGVLLAWLPVGRSVGAAVAAGRPSAARNACASGGAEMLRLARIVRGDASAPYASRFASSSGRRTPPDRLMPANSPFAREYERISAVSCASVPTLPARPIGPAATDASAPRFTLLFSSFWTPCSFMMRSTRSTCSAPA